MCATALAAQALAPSACGGAATSETPAEFAEGLIETTAPSQSALVFSAGDKKPRLVEGSAGVSRVFDVTVPQTGRYHVRAWAMGVNGGRLAVYLDARPQPVGFITRTDSGWHYHDVVSSAGGDTLVLPGGTHTLSFRSQGDDVPDLESVQVSKNAFAPSSDDDNYAKYIASLQANSLAADYAAKKAASDDITALGASPDDNYCYSLGMPFSYSYRGLFYFSAGQSVVFETRKADPYGSDPVLYLFSYSNPEAASWSNDDYNGWQSRIAATIPTAGLYWLLARTWNPYTPGTSDLYKDGSLYTSNIALAGNRLKCLLNKTGMALNYFTSFLAGDTMLWVVDQATGNPTGLVGAFNDDYTTSSDFSWGLASRVHRTSSRVPAYAIITAYSTFGLFGTADVYLENEDSDIMGYFENLKAADAIKSAPASSVYRCISYSGGVTTFYTWPPSPGDPWYDPDPLTAFDKWYGNTPARYVPGAWTYSRNGATESTSVVDLWARNGVYQHGSVKKPGNDWPHGYDWESKPGILTRTFHPRHALRGASYGDVVAYYIWTGQTTSAAGASKVAAPAGGPAMLTDALAAGVAVLEQPTLTTAETGKLQALKSALSSSVSAQFERLYAAWKATWARPEFANQSNPDAFTESREYADLLQYCREPGRALWPVTFERHLAGDGDTFAFRLIQDLTLPEQEAALTRIQQESAHERYTADGKYIVPSLHANFTKFVQTILAQM